MILTPENWFGGSAPSIPQTMLFIVGDSTAPAAADVAIKAGLEARGWAVTYADDDTFVNADATSYSAVLVSDSVAVAPLSADLYDQVKGWVLLDRGLTDDWLIDSAGAANMPAAIATINILTNSHPITSPNSTGSLTILSSTRTMAEITKTNLGAGATILAEHTTDNTQATLVAYETGSALSGGSSAPARRVYSCMQNCGSQLNSDGLDLLSRCLLWVAEIL